MKNQDPLLWPIFRQVFGEHVAEERARLATEHGRLPNTTEVRRWLAGEMSEPEQDVMRNFIAYFFPVVYQYVEIVRSGDEAAFEDLWDSEISLLRVPPEK